MIPALCECSVTALSTAVNGCWVFLDVFAIGSSFLQSEVDDTNLPNLKESIPTAAMMIIEF